MRIVFTLFVLLLSGAGAVVAQTDTRFSERIACQEAEAAALRLQAVSSLAGRNYDLRYHRLYCEIDPNVRFIKGGVTSYFVVKAGGADTISFDMSHQLVIDSIRYHGSAVPHTLAANQLRINVPGVLPAGQLDSVAIWYHGVPPQTGLGSFMKASTGTGPIIWTLSDPYGGKDWWPCKMSLDDKIDSADVLVRTPQAYRAASNGLLVRELPLGTDKLYHWRHRYPITSYLIAWPLQIMRHFTVYGAAAAESAA